MYHTIMFCSVALLAGCTSPPKPLVVDGSDRQAINISKTTGYSNQTIFSDLKPHQESMTGSSQIFHIYFPYNNAQLYLTSTESEQLLSKVTGAQRIDLRGRTDNQHPNSSDEKIALDRALAVQRYLITHSIPAEIISINYLSAGDYIADNTLATGQKKNRRVDIEIFYP